MLSIIFSHGVNLKLQSKNSRVRFLGQTDPESGSNWNEMWVIKCLSDSDSESVWPGFLVGSDPKMRLASRDPFRVKSGPGVFFRVYSTPIPCLVDHDDIVPLMTQRTTQKPFYVGFLYTSLNSDNGCIYRHVTKNCTWYNGFELKHWYPSMFQ